MTIFKKRAIRKAVKKLWPNYKARVHKRGQCYYHVEFQELHAFSCKPASEITHV